ncbi:hypothetical protein Q0Z83_096180 [Actinoplanes sichuanensis]|uniref:DUF4328 domain-containing protein n=1 Tax=Actinoplanes sichuanensis TaxID=512349 RepID=A0ABW4AS02_9ACTN|nr:hypothetical protein [Actinoplanes sichuanensis]BEL11427.1 hypothetical protein Q0Z83_096180 [Actinoplanes sichuanensis]
MTDEKAPAEASGAETSAAVTSGAETSAVVTEEPPAAGLPDDVKDILLRVAGLTVALVATVLTVFVELELSALRTGAIGAVLDGDSPWTGSGAPLPVAVPLTVGVNLGIAWFAVTTTGRRWAAGPPWAVWTLLMLVASGTRTAEGDYLVGGTNWVALVVILAGSLTFAVYVYRMILAPVRRGSELSGSV